MGNYALESPAASRVVVALAITLPTLLGYAIAFGLISIVNAFLHAFFHFAESVAGAVVGWFPGANKWVKGKIEAAEHKATDRLGDAAHNLEGRVADAFHASANQVHSIGHEIYGLSIALWQMSHFLHSWGHPSLMRERNATLDRQQKANLERAKTNARNQAKLKKALWGTAAGLAGLNVGATFKRLASQHAHTQKQIHAIHGGYALPGAVPIPRDYPSTRERAKTAERTNESLWDRVNDIGRKLTLPLSAALVVTAIAKLGFDWIRCSKLRRFGPRICNIDGSLLETLLLGTTAIFGAISLVTMAEALLELEDELVPLVLAGFREFDGVDLS